jgi:hypothetical protein
MNIGQRYLVVYRTASGHRKQLVGTYKGPTQEGESFTTNGGAVVINEERLVSTELTELPIKGPAPAHTYPVRVTFMVDADDPVKSRYIIKEWLKESDPPVNVHSDFEVG